MDNDAAAAKQEFRAALYDALMRAAESAGNDLKGLSWFARNHVEAAQKEAA